ncbi:MmgE/PrpD family protein [Roseovarius faecimaris]|uniref:MmgE/PrpD family protein n=1 Tax=Roseovarius faecimaris TaxID=2494550 RepID=A0A6I6IQ13_9RHOB|nr:MmgE/PrpD family protein [Roseovarius faecimaris]QGX98352.1 MmgE/PrpD family protein [Roseovarius faecimaris]
MQLMDQLLDLAAMREEDLPGRALALARFSLLDWMACGLAGKDEPLARKLRSLAVSEGGRPVASVIGGEAAPARMAALVNGATSHALDYDDTHFAHVGHLSVAIYPAALAVAEDCDATAGALVAGFLIGAEAAIRVGKVLGRAHYNLGFHQTATAGAFGATVAAGRLYDLNRDQMRVALGLCATRASGLKSQFGTMGKPYNAGIAAANGVECAALARLGFTSADDGLAGPQGFVETHTPEIGAVEPLSGMLFEDNKYKLHACCHGTHAMIEALLAVRGKDALDLDAVEEVALRTNPRWLKVCDIKLPRTGLEVKFSYAWLAGMALRGDGTGDDRAYTDALASDGALAAFARRVRVTGDETVSDLQAEGQLRFRDGTVVPLSHDLADEIPQEVLARRLRQKAEALLGARGGALWDMADRLDQCPARAIGAQLAAPLPDGGMAAG